MEHLPHQRRRPAEQEKALAAFLDEVQNQVSPNHHRWLTPEEAAQFDAGDEQPAVCGMDGSAGIGAADRSPAGPASGLAGLRSSRPQNRRKPSGRISAEVVPFCAAPVGTFHSALDKISWLRSFPGADSSFSETCAPQWSRPAPATKGCPALQPQEAGPLRQRAVEARASPVIFSTSACRLLPAASIVTMAAKRLARTCHIASGMPNSIR
jgi:hypothetical protein